MDLQEKEKELIKMTNEAKQIDKSLDHEILIEMMLHMVRKSEELTTLKGKQVIEEFVRRLKPYYE